MVGIAVSIFPFQFVFELNISIWEHIDAKFEIYSMFNRMCFINEFRKKKKIIENWWTKIKRKYQIKNNIH